MSVNAWIIVGDQPAIGNLITVARSLGGQVAAVVAGTPVGGRDGGGERCGQGGLVRRAG